MSDITVNGLTFEPYIKREEIAKQVQRVADEIKRDCQTNCPLFLCVLNGAYMFAADLYRSIDINTSEITFIRFKSYEGTSSTGAAKEIMGLSEDITGREIIIIEDIVDTGVTAKQLREMLVEHGAASVKMATLLFKPESLKQGTPPEYVGFEIPSKFIIGYGLDLDGVCRNLPDIYILKEQNK
ncbi:MAG: hypoxanthine phosphoribosyltransferase [Bacteroidales bacterium]|nr:hypoxanthine phosphoribosyltransferase [Candidatus Sodaliphilus aphodohippi]